MIINGPVPDRRHGFALDLLFSVDSKKSKSARLPGLTTMLSHFALALSHDNRG
jgi:hypothetical protein